MKKITFEIETITPMFLAGADQSKAELRAASIKGLLRFWWRALQAESDMKKLKERESKIFGSSDEKIGGGSSFSVRVFHEGALNVTKNKFPKHNINVTSKGRTFPVNILEYLAYGTCEYRKGEGNVFIREYIPQGLRFKMDINLFRENCIDEILKTVYIFGLFGGIGSRNRNGFGSFAILNRTDVFEPFADIDSINNPYTKANLLKFIKNTDSQTYTSFSSGTKIFRTQNHFDTWDKAQADVGKIYRGIRSGEIKNTHNKQVFESKHSYEKRQYIGSPIIVDKKEKSFLDRHAKPYFIKIAKEGYQYRGYILYLPSRYCDGLEKDRSDRPINHNNVNEKFAEFCAEFNNFLANNMETVI